MKYRIYLYDLELDEESERWQVIGLINTNLTINIDEFETEKGVYETVCQKLCQHHLAREPFAVITSSNNLIWSFERLNDSKPLFELRRVQK